VLPGKNEERKKGRVIGRWKRKNMRKKFRKKKSGKVCGVLGKEPENFNTSIPSSSSSGSAPGSFSSVSTSAFPASASGCFPALVSSVSYELGKSKRKREQWSEDVNRVSGPAPGLEENKECGRDVSVTREAASEYSMVKNKQDEKGEDVEKMWKKRKVDEDEMEGGGDWENPVSSSSEKTDEKMKGKDIPCGFYLISSPAVIQRARQQQDILNSKTPQQTDSFTQAHVQAQRPGGPSSRLLFDILKADEVVKLVSTAAAYATPQTPTEFSSYFTITGPSVSFPLPIPLSQPVYVSAPSSPQTATEFPASPSVSTEGQSSSIKVKPGQSQAARELSEGGVSDGGTAYVLKTKSNSCSKGGSPIPSAHLVLRLRGGSGRGRGKHKTENKKKEKEKKKGTDGGESVGGDENKTAGGSKVKAAGNDGVITEGINGNEGDGEKEEEVKAANRFTEVRLTTKGDKGGEGEGYSESGEEVEGE
jgi:hypothetical protein